MSAARAKTRARVVPRVKVDVDRGGHVFIAIDGHDGRRPVHVVYQVGGANPTGWAIARAFDCVFKLAGVSRRVSGARATPPLPMLQSELVTRARARRRGAS